MCRDDLNRLRKIAISYECITYGFASLRQCMGEKNEEEFLNEMEMMR